MRWPWVSRSTLLSVQHAASQAADLATARISALETDLRTERDRYERLVTHLGQLQRQGFQPPPALPDAPAASPLPPEVVSAMGAHMDLSGPSARGTARVVRDWLAKGTPIAEVVKRIHEGVQ